MLCFSIFFLCFALSVSIDVVVERALIGCSLIGGGIGHYAAVFVLRYRDSHVTSELIAFAQRKGKTPYSVFSCSIEMEAMLCAPIGLLHVVAVHLFGTVVVNFLLWSSIIANEIIPHTEFQKLKELIVHSYNGEAPQLLLDAHFGPKAEIIGGSGQRQHGGYQQYKCFIRTHCHL